MKQRFAQLRRLVAGPEKVAKTAPIPPQSPTTSFTAHNIRLDDGTLTCPELDWTMDRNPILLSVARVLRLVFPRGLDGRSIVDVGCLEGGFATEFARMGMVSRGIEIRESNFANCLRVKQGVALPDLAFSRDDAMNIASYGPVDAMFVCGLLYHLDNPRAFIADAAAACRRVMFVDTHVAPASDEAPANKIYGLSAVTEHTGLKGRWFVEYGDVGRDELDRMKWASWSNSRSFWVQKEHLVQLMRDCGFATVFELFDCEADIANEYTVGWRGEHARVLLAGIKEP